MSKAVIDIETVGFDFESFEKRSQDYLLKYAENEEEEKEIKNKLSFYPLTGETVAIGILNPETQKGCVLFQSKNVQKLKEDGILYESGNEKDILEKFWNLIKTYQQIITFNGRGFDVPFLMLRSAINKIKPSRNFLGYRFDHKTHCDLLEQFTFYGEIRKFNLDFYAKTFGIKSSKDGGIDGSMVRNMYKQEKYLEIAKYCADDLKTTAELYEYWDKYLKF